MKITTLGCVEIGTKFEFGGEVFIRVGESSAFNIYNEMPMLKCFTSEDKINIHWWEALKNPTKIQIMEAHEDGAMIEFKHKVDVEDCYFRVARSHLNSCKLVWNWEDNDYRIKPVEYVVTANNREYIVSKELFEKVCESKVKI